MNTFSRTGDMIDVRSSNLGSRRKKVAENEEGDKSGQLDCRPVAGRQVAP